MFLRLVMWLLLSVVVVVSFCDLVGYLFGVDATIIIFVFVFSGCCCF